MAASRPAFSDMRGWFGTRCLGYERQWRIHAPPPFRKFCLNSTVYNYPFFNPYELYCDEQEMLPNDDYDPDTQYHNQTPQTKHFKYHSISECNSSVSDNSSFSLCHCNIRSATKNGNNLSNRLNSLALEFYIIALTETWLNENNTEIVFFLQIIITYLNIEKIGKGRCFNIN